MTFPCVERLVRQIWFRRRWIISVLLAGQGLLVAIHLVAACATGPGAVMAPPPAVEGAHFVGSGSCAACHAEIATVFPDSVHARMHSAADEDGVDRSCESCHGPGSRHVESGGGTAFARLIVNPGESPEACFKCHLAQHAEFRLPSRHPVVEGKMSCVHCHDPHGHDISKPAGGLSIALRNQSCAECHREQTRPFVFEHEAMREGCTVCHQPHGSVNDKLLVQRDANLCLKCHAQVPAAPGTVMIGKVDHSFFLRQGSCSTVGCHTAVHGSNIHPKLLY